MPEGSYGDGSPPARGHEMENNDSSPEENDFRRELEEPIARLARAVGPCPHPDLLMAAVGAPPGESDVIREHVRLCPVCRQLSDDLLAYGRPAALSEKARIRLRWRVRPVWIVWAALAAVLLLGGLTFILLTVRQRLH